MIFTPILWQQTPKEINLDELTERDISFNHKEQINEIMKKTPRMEQQPNPPIGSAFFTLNTPNQIQSVAFSPNGIILASGSLGNTIQFWNASNGAKLSTLTRNLSSLVFYGIFSIDFSPDGTILASSGGDILGFSKAGDIILWDTSDGEVLRTIQTEYSEVSSVAFSPDGTILAAGSGGNILDFSLSPAKEGTITLWNIDSAIELLSIKGINGGVQSIAFSPDGSLLASGGGGNTTKLWNAKNGIELHTLTGHTDWIRSVSFSPDGTIVASCNNDNTIKVWDVVTGKELHTLIGHTDSVESVSFSPDGTILASGSWDKTIKLWNTSDGTELYSLTEHTERVNSVAFSPDGTILASGSLDETIKLWNVDSISKDNDLDFDGIANLWERQYGLNPSNF